MTHSALTAGTQELLGGRAVDSFSFPEIKSRIYLDTDPFGRNKSPQTDFFYRGRRSTLTREEA